MRLTEFTLLIEEVERLRRKRRADQQLRLAAPEGVEDPLCRTDRRRGIGVEPVDRKRGEELSHLSLQTLRPTADRAKARAAAGGASVERGGDQAAAVATQERAGAVQDERSLARGAGLSGAAITTEDRRCKAASVDDQQRLCAGIPRDRFQVGKERT